jgi:solute carrier family 31 (copper transporter), member 1
VLFNWWETKGPWTYLLTLLFWFLCGIFYEFVNITLTQKQFDLFKFETDYHQFLSRGLVSLLYLLKMFLAYILMLVIMTYNVGLFFAIIFGLSIGHFFFFTKGFISDAKEIEYGALDSISSSCH